MTLSPSIIMRCPRRKSWYPIGLPTAPSTLRSGYKLLTDNRDAYIAQSRSMQPPQPGTLPRPVADGCANFAREYERQEMLDGRFPDLGD